MNLLFYYATLDENVLAGMQKVQRAVYVDIPISNVSMCILFLSLHPDMSEKLLTVTVSHNPSESEYFCHTGLIF